MGSYKGLSKKYNLIKGSKLIEVFTGLDMKLLKK